MQRTRRRLQLQLLLLLRLRYTRFQADSGKSGILFAVEQKQSRCTD